MAIPIKSNVFWVGKKDWDLRKFHGDEYSTPRGSSYNSYLVREEKVVLIDTVWKPHSSSFIADLKDEIELSEIDFIVINHAEIDHSGALPELLKHIPDTPIYCTQKGVDSLKGHYHLDWNFNVVKTGDGISLGEKELIFIETPMLHWPDSMMCYLTGDAILFSNDAFGQHYASEHLYNDQVDSAELLSEAIKYYANILTPFSHLLAKKIDEILSLGFPVEMICPSHGIIWRNDPIQIIETYLEWAKNYQENQITILYDTMWEGTRIMAENIARGIQDFDSDITIKIFYLSNTDKNDIITEVFKSRMILVGSPTINNGILVSVAGFLEQAAGMKFKNKKAVGFGSYGWSGEAVTLINERLLAAGFERIGEGLKIKWKPDKSGLQECRDFGNQLARN